MTAARIPTLVLALSGVAVANLGAQDSLFHYDVKFVCGSRAAPTTTAETWQTVAPGSYFTAINILNPSGKTASIRTDIANTILTPDAGSTRAGPADTLPHGLALEIDCADIRQVRRPPPFLKGFVRVASTTPLTVTAVYTAANRAGVASIDVESVSGGRRCPDLAVGRTYRPTLDRTSNRTIVRFDAWNLGNADVGAFVARVDDPSRAPQPDRIAETTVTAGLAAGAMTTVTLELTYIVEGNENIAALLLSLDPKEMIAECREDNNTATVGAPSP